LHGLDLPGTKWRETHERERRRRLEAHQRRTQDTSQRRNTTTSEAPPPQPYLLPPRAPRLYTQHSERPRSGSVREQPFR
jgi:hypothetical protein